MSLADIIERAMYIRDFTITTILLTGRCYKLVDRNTERTTPNYVTAWLQPSKGGIAQPRKS